MKPELEIATRRLKAQWPGHMRRVVYPGRKGFPDWLLTHEGRVGFVELKAAPTETTIIDLSEVQRAELVELDKEGLTAGVLTLIGEHEWTWHQPPWRHPKLYGWHSGRSSIRITPALIFGPD